MDLPLTFMGWVKGLEPSISRATIWRLSQLGHTHHWCIRFVRRWIVYRQCPQPHNPNRLCGKDFAKRRVAGASTAAAQTRLPLCTLLRRRVSPLLARQSPAPCHPAAPTAACPTARALFGRAPATAICPGIAKPLYWCVLWGSTYGSPLQPDRGVAQFGSASALGAEGRRFKSGHPDHAAVVQW